MHAIHTPVVYGDWTGFPSSDESSEASIDLAVSAALDTALLDAEVDAVESGLEALRGQRDAASPEAAPARTALLDVWDRGYGGAPPAESARAIGLANEVETVATEPTRVELLAAWDRACRR